MLAFDTAVAQFLGALDIRLLLPANPFGTGSYGFFWARVPDSGQAGSWPDRRFLAIGLGVDHHSSEGSLTSGPSGGVPPSAVAYSSCLPVRVGTRTIGGHRSRVVSRRGRSRTRKCRRLLRSIPPKLLLRRVRCRDCRRRRRDPPPPQRRPFGLPI